MKKMGLLGLCLVFLAIGCDRGNVASTYQVEKLKQKVDSLETYIADIKVSPYLDSDDFLEVEIGNSCKVKFVAVIENELTIDSVFINGIKADDNDESIAIRTDQFGPLIEFTPNSMGTFEMVAYAKFKKWGAKTTSFSWPVTVKDTVKE